jgi:hypothetical protein
MFRWSADLQFLGIFFIDNPNPDPYPDPDPKLRLKPNLNPDPKKVISVPQHLLWLNILKG